MKYLVINVTKYLQDLYKKKCKFMIKDIKELNKWRDIPCSWKKGHSIVKMQFFPT